MHPALAAGLVSPSSYPFTLSTNGAERNGPTGGTDGRVVFGVTEQDDPAVADKVVEVNGAICRLGLEVGRNGAEAQTVARQPYAAPAPKEAST